MEKDIIYVIGHKSPDTDTLCSAIAYAALLKKKKINAVPAVYGDLNPETQYALDLFKVKDFQKVKTIKNKTVVLVDHNEPSQSPEGIEEAKVVGIIDHHKINFSSSDPIEIDVKPYGSTATIIAEKMMTEQFKINKQMAGILLSAILSDTIIFKSTTTTKTDIKIAKELAKIAGVDNIKTFGIELKKKKASLSGLSAKKVIYSDFKIFELADKKFGIGQVEIVDPKEGKERKAELIAELNKINEEEGLTFTALMLTDIMKEGSEVIIAGDKSYIEKAFKTKIESDSSYFPGMMSRKKDLVPKIMEIA